MFAASLAALVLLQPLPAVAAESSLFQQDTLVIRKGKIDIERGILAPGADTVIIRIDSAALFETPVVDAPDLSELSFDELLTRGDELRRDYEFSKALETYQAAREKAASETDRTSSGRKIVMAQHGMTLSEACRIPNVVAKQRFSLKDFFLFYPLEGGSWRAAPNSLDPAPDSLVGATFFPREATSVFFSKADEDGFRNIYYTEASGKEWTFPRQTEENLLSQGNEIYPMLSPDGWTLYFASDGLYGMGGYDLYYSVRADDGSWGEPVNMGFPFSSPGDDFLLIDTPDGKYTLFASNRECAADSVYLYVLEQDPAPIRRAVTDPAELRDLCSLSPTADPTRMDTASAISDEIPDNDNTRLYQEKSAEVSRLRDSVYHRERALDALRKELSGITLPEERQALADRISQQEAALAPFREDLAKASSEVQDIEMNFLRTGVDSKVRRTADREVVGARSGYVFAKKSAGGKLSLRLADAPVDSTDVFRIAPIGRFAKDNALPDGIVYQIRLFSSPTHASVEDLQGLTPVYERLTSSLQFTYAAGIFRTYSSALSHLAAVRRLGFPEATVIAFIGGRPVDTSTAREAEAYAARRETSQP